MGCPAVKPKKSCKKKTDAICPAKKRHQSKKSCCCKKIIVKKQIVQVNIPQSAIGTAGAVAPSFVSEFGYIYNLAGQVVAKEEDVIFDTNGTLTPGIIHAPGTAEITVMSPGHYELTVSASGEGPSQFALFLNGILVPGTIYGSGAGTQQNNGQAIIALSAGDVLTLRNHSSVAAVTLRTLVGGTQPNVNASILIKKLN
ncbi:hypothetical protein M3194_12575 [Paenibacillus glycanilyticus]|uniref:BclA C-terminal domain-containing protein n=1 Tax=Paenibacillus glycanilyticus TaxID=126569 RepID=UPI00203B348E|nr:hypothetical protein [Paenibacillus glycanilyticus]MCM3628199.1 hypothetical protein [Paenibacillus glycanilyticus]